MKPSEKVIIFNCPPPPDFNKHGHRFDKPRLECCCQNLNVTSATYCPVPLALLGHELLLGVWMWQRKKGADKPCVLRNRSKVKPQLINQNGPENVKRVIPTYGRERLALSLIFWKLISRPCSYTISLGGTGTWGAPGDACLSSSLLGEEVNYLWVLM